MGAVSSVTSEIPPHEQESWTEPGSGVAMLRQSVRHPGPGRRPGKSDLTSGRGRTPGGSPYSKP